MPLKNTLFLALLLLFALPITFCTASKKSGAKAAKQDIPKVSYKTDLQPIMVRSCSPCHFPETGKKKMLDTYEATKENIYDIIGRVELPAEDIKFMPFKSKKTPLTAEEIKLFKAWALQGMPE